MNYIVLDLEFNQAYDFEDGNITELDPKCRFEIIQIGAIKLNENFNIIDSFNVMIKPQIYKRIHPFVEKLTGIKYEDLENCNNFQNVFYDFYKFISNDFDKNILCTWGYADIKALYRNIAYYNLLDEPLIFKYIDLQAITTKQLKYKRGLIGLKNAVELLNIDIDNNFHNAYNDAMYTTKIFLMLKQLRLKFKVKELNSLKIKK